MSLSAFLDEWLSGFFATGRLLVGFSGGLDSTALLHALAQTSQKHRLLAVHVDHALQPESDEWAVLCRRQAAEWGVPFDCLQARVEIDRGQSPEAAAREARYRALYQMAEEGDGLLTAHHRDDQAETLLLNLMRGSGLDGLAAMPEVKPWGPPGHREDGAGRWHGRPLLRVSRQALRAYADEHGLEWVEDPSNADTDFDRNFLRHRVLPLLETRWPRASDSLARSADWLGEALQLQQKYSRQMVADCAEGRRLSLSPLWSQAPLEAKAALRSWLADLGLPPLPSARLESLLALAGPDHARRGEVAWAGARVRRYCDCLYATLDNDPVPDTRAEWQWHPAENLDIDGLSEPLSRDWCERQGVTLPELEEGACLRVCFRPRASAQDRLTDLSGRRPSRSQKHFFQESAVPPWAREYCPYLYHNGRLVGILIDWGSV